MNIPDQSDMIAMIRDLPLPALLKVATMGALRMMTPAQYAAMLEQAGAVCRDMSAGEPGAARAKMEAAGVPPALVGVLLSYVADNTGDGSDHDLRQNGER